MTSTALSTHAGGLSGPLSLMSCVRESSPQDSINELEIDKNVSSKKKFWNPRKWFKRKSHHHNHNKIEDAVSQHEGNDATLEKVVRSRSASELSEGEEQQQLQHHHQHLSSSAGGRRRSGTPMHPGLSVSHDSIFRSPNSGSELELDEAQSSSSLSIQHHPTQTELRLQTELSERLRLRRGRGDVSEDDEGLPRSPCCNSPTATEGLLEKGVIKSHPTKSHSTCSDGSLLSMGSSEIEEDSFGQHSSRHSSKLSLYDSKKNEPISTTKDSSEWELGLSSAPLNHSAAHHRVAVRPKRTHGAPRRKRTIQPVAGTTLPTTPEVNEDSMARSLTPDTAGVAKEMLELCNTSSKVTALSTSASITKTETQLKCSSLPLGLVGPIDEEAKLNRSLSNAGSKSQDSFATLGEEEEEHLSEKRSDSLFARLFPRRSAKKKRAKLLQQQQQQLQQQQIHQQQRQTSTTYSSKMLESTTATNTTVTKFTDKRSSAEVKNRSVPRSGPASRQRVQPLDITLETVDLPKNESPESSPPKLPGSSSLFQLELESRCRNISLMPPKIIGTLPVVDPLPSGDNHDIKTENSNNNNKNRFVISDSSKSITRSSIEESKSKVKIAGLSSLQQRVLNVEEEIFKDSLNDFITNEQSSQNQLSNSHSFKSDSSGESVSAFKESEIITESFLSEERVLLHRQSTTTTSNHIFKASSLDSLKHLSSPDLINTQKRPHPSSSSSESIDSINSTKTSVTEYMDSLTPCINNGITISGPSHTSVVNISSGMPDVQIVDSVAKSTQSTILLNSDYSPEKELDVDRSSPQEQQVSVTKIQLVKPDLPVKTISLLDSLNPEIEPLSNIISISPPKNVILPLDVETKPKSLFNFELNLNEALPRKFSQDNIEVVEQETVVKESVAKANSTPSTPNVIITSMAAPPVATRMFKKQSETITQSRKASLTSNRNSDQKTTTTSISLRTKSNSVDIVDSLKRTSEHISSTDCLKQKVSSTNDLQEVSNNTSESIVTLRRKSLKRPKHGDDEPPELMKVFARRSLKLKDGSDEYLDILTTQDCTNHDFSDEISEMLVDSLEPLKPVVVEVADKPKDNNNKENIAVTNNTAEPILVVVEPIPKKPAILPKDPLIETKLVEITPLSRKPVMLNNRLFSKESSPFIVPKVKNEINNGTNNITSNEKVVVHHQKIVKNWISQTQEDTKESDIIITTNISSKSDYINEEEFQTHPKNFNQRKAEWEKRAQEALKKKC